jgi:DNA-binding GntR family transcriptional regulator
MPGSTLRDEIAEELRERILTGTMNAGMRLDLDRLAADFAVSRTPVREALLLLARDGLVEFNPRQSGVVIGITPADIRDIYLVFGVVQGLAAAAVAASGDDVLVGRLARLAAEVEAGSSDGPEQMDRHNAAFHRAINTACGSRVLRNQLRQLNALIPRRYFARFPDQYVSGMAEHWELVDAIRAGDCEAARRIAEAHFAKAGQRLYTWLDGGGQIEVPSER